MDKSIDHSPGTNWRFMLRVTVKLVEGLTGERERAIAADLTEVTVSTRAALVLCVSKAVDRSSRWEPVV
jgi:hypothetical protein